MAFCVVNTIELCSPLVAAPHPVGLATSRPHPQPVDREATPPRAPRCPGTEEADSLNDTTTSADTVTSGDRGALVVTAPLRRIGRLLATATPPVRLAVRDSGDWAGLSGDLVPTRSATVCHVPVDVVRRAMGTGSRRHAEAAPRSRDQVRFGPSDDVDHLLRANQPPMLGGFGDPALSTTDQTALIPRVPREPPPDPAPSFEPITGELPVSGELPAPVEPGAGNRSRLPDLPTLPALPPPARGSDDLFTPYLPVQSTPDVPVTAAQRLMAQLRGLVSELESSGNQGCALPDVRTPDRWEPPAL